MSKSSKLPVCPRCKGPVRLAGFERNTITRGPNKGQSTVRNLYSCQQGNACPGKATG